MAEKYDRIGKHYNQTRKADAYLVSRIFHHLKPVKEETYLDIGCGTGNYTTALNEKGITFIGVEPSIEMLKQAKLRSDKIDWRRGKAEDLPIENESVAGILATLTTHHWENFEKAFTELNRVLKPNGRIVIFTSNRDLMEGYWLNHYFPTMLEESNKQMPSYKITIKALKNGGFEIIETEKYFVREDLEDLFLYSAKHRPQMYLDETFRAGISSFYDLANAKEVENGLTSLKEDIKTGEIKNVMNKYENEKGDYLFIICEKR